MRSTDKKAFIPIIILLIISLLSISIGFSSMSTTLSVNGNAAFIPVDMIRFTALETNELKNAYEESKSFLTNDLNFNIELDLANSTATYDVTLSNLGQVDKILSSITNEIYSNDIIKYELSGIGLNSIIKKGEVVNFQITFKYKNNVDIQDTKLNAKLRFNFDDYVNSVGSYLIVFNSNGGSGSMQDMQVVYDQYKKLNANTFYKDGYYFKEWNTEPDGTGKKYRNGQNIKNISNGEDSIVLYAQWADELDNVYYPGSCTFNGAGNDVEGNCAEGESQDYINTGIAPFSESNYQKSFVLSFTITDVDDDLFNSTARATIFNMLYENNDNIKGRYPGSLLRVENKKWMVQGGDGRSNSTKVSFNKNDLLNKEFKLIRHNDGNTIKLYYVIGDDAPIFLRDVTNLYAPFDTPLTFGANLLIDNATSDRHAIATVEDINFMFVDNDLTLYEIINGKNENIVEDEEVETVFSLDGPCIFNGNDNITGDNCDEYSNINYIDTNVYLFNSENYDKDFIVSFVLDDYVTSQQIDKQVTIFNAFLERTGLGYGMLLRRESNKFELIVRDGNGHDMKTSVPLSNPLFVKMVRKDNIVCYSINNSKLKRAVSMEQFTDPFNVPLTFGGSIDKTGKPFRFIKGSISDMLIQVGKVDEECEGD